MITIKNCDTEKLKSILMNTKGKLFSVSFIKKNGELRNMVARLDVKSRAKNPNKKSTVEQKHLPYVLVFDFHKDSYKTVNYNTIQNIKFQNTLYER